jgi:CelD/BcsL family acetyltransferase involved in cellulose biosynthesis
MAGFAGILSALYVEDTLLAAHMGMRSERVWHYWFPAFNKAYAKYSPGLLLLLEMARAAPAMGIATIDLGAGTESYKARMGSGSIRVARGEIELPSVAVALRQTQKLVERCAVSWPLAAATSTPRRVVRRFRKWARFR